MAEDVKVNYVPTQLNVKITKKSSDVDAFIYGGPSRLMAKTMIIDGNKPIEVGSEF